MIEIPIGWILSVLLGAGGIISTLSTVLWKTMKGRLEIQDKIIEKLQNDIDRLSKGCGMDSCLWRKR